ncbi:MAG: hypothetical protein QOI78_2176 [Actinomycetota bacterium]|jgi:hypothetical protein|nr:hypothetical protein [Actinomycetota bacterium]
MVSGRADSGAGGTAVSGSIRGGDPQRKDRKFPEALSIPAIVVRRVVEGARGGAGTTTGYQIPRTRHHD